MLRLLQAEPLQMVSHLTFQEYYTARAICRGSQLQEKPWHWSPWWANVLSMGLDLGDQFGSGLLRASGVTGEKLDLNGQLPRGDRPLAIDAIIALVRSKDTPLTHVDLRGNRLEEFEMLRIGKAMLSNFKSQITGVAADPFNMKVEDNQLTVPRMRIRPEGFVLLAGALRSNSTLTSLDVSSNYMVQWAGHQRNKIVPAQLCGVEALAQAISNSTRQIPSALRHLDLASNALGLDGAATIRTILTNRALKSLSLRDNKLGNEGISALVPALKKSHLTYLNVAENAVGLEGVQALASALHEMTALTELDFSANHVLGNNAVDAPDVVGVRELGIAIGQSHLKRLDLSSCQLCGVWDDADCSKHGDLANFTLGGIQAISEALVKCSSLTSISMLHNQIELSPHATRALESANRRRATAVEMSY